MKTKETSTIGEKVQVETEESHKSRATKFEEEIKQFLTKLGFIDVDGAKDNFFIGEVQVDACGGHERTLVIVECIMQKTLGKKSLRDKIKSVRGCAPSIERGIRSHGVYKKYKNVRYVLATKNIDVRKEDYDFANSDNPRIYIWNDLLVEYYKDLHAKIKQYARYNLMGEMAIRPIEDTMISVPAFEVSIGKVKMYSFLANPKDLLEVSYVARREKGNERYYQRIVKKDRLTKIATYIKAKNILPNNLIISFGESISRSVEFKTLDQNFQGRCTLGLGVTFGILQFPREYRSCWIIDGQHRLYSFVNLDNEIINMPIVAFKNLNIETQGKIFLDINKNQKPVPADLVWDLNGDMIPSEEEGMIARVVKGLNSSGPMHYRIYIPSSGIKKPGGLLKIAGICLALKRTKMLRQTTQSKTENPFYNPSSEVLVKNILKALNDYFEVVLKMIPQEKDLNNKGFVLDDSGNAVMIRLFEKIVSRCGSDDSNPRKPNDEDYEKYLKPIIDQIKTYHQNKESLKQVKSRITSEGGKDMLLKEYIQIIRNTTGDTFFGGKFDSTGGNEIKELESLIKHFIYNVIGDPNNPEWFIIKVPSDISSRAEKNWRKHGGTDRSAVYLQMTFGDCATIIKHNKDLFYPLIKREKSLATDSLIEAAFDMVSLVRTNLFHDIGSVSKAYDHDLFNTLYSSLRKAIEGALSKKV